MMMQSYFSSLLTFRQQNNTLLSGVVPPVIVVIALLLSLDFVTPYWQTNDDVGMSMRAHGYGAFHSASEYLIFSNVVWGKIVSLIPNLGGYLGYSLATYLTLVISAGMTCFYLNRLGAGSVASVLITFSAYFYPFIFPQFTVNAGLLGVSGVLALFYYLRRRHISALFVFFSFSFISYIIRWNEFAFVVIVASPLLFTFAFTRDRTLLFACGLLAASMLLCSSINTKYYENESWKKFKEFNSSRVLLTDYGVGEKLKSSEIANTYGLSENDFDLLRQWFFVDDDITSSEIFRNLTTTEMKTAEIKLTSLKENISLTTTQFFDNRTLPFTLLLLTLIVLSLSGRSIASLIIFGACILYFVYIGRPIPFRVYYPILIFLIFWVILSIFDVKSSNNKKKLAIIFIIIAGCYAVLTTCTTQAPINKLANQVKFDASTLDARMLVIWGALFPYELLYSPLDRSMYRRNLNFYTLGSSTYSPTSKAYASETSDDTSFVNRLISVEGVDFVGYNNMVIPQNGIFLKRYCAERHGKILQLNLEKTLQSISIVNARCNLGYSKLSLLLKPIFLRVNKDQD